MLPETRRKQILEILKQVEAHGGAVSFVVMRERGIEEVFTFDNHFANLGSLNH